MMNRYIVKAVDAVVATDDNDPITGITSDRWKSAQIKDNSGVVKEVSKDTNLIYQSEINANVINTALSKIVSVEIGEIPDPNKTTAIQIPLSVMEFSYGVDIFGIQVLGVQHKDPLVAHTVLDKNNNELAYIIIENKMIFNIENKFKIQSGSTINFIVYYR